MIFKKMHWKDQQEKRTGREFAGKILKTTLIPVVALGISSLASGQILDKQNSNIMVDKTNSHEKKVYVVNKENGNTVYTVPYITDDTIVKTNYRGNDKCLIKNDQEVAYMIFTFPYISNDTIMKTEYRGKNRYLIIKMNELSKSDDKEKYDVEIKLDRDKPVAVIEFTDLGITIIFSDGSEKTYFDRKYKKQAKKFGFGTYTNRAHEISGQTSAQTNDGQIVIKADKTRGIFYTINKKSGDTVATTFMVPYRSNDAVIKTEYHNDDRYLIIKNKKYDVEIKLETGKSVVAVDLFGSRITVTFLDGFEGTEAKFIDKTYLDKKYTEKAKKLGFETYENRKH